MVLSPAPMATSIVEMSCSYKYYKDTVVTLSAEANEGSTFIGWKPESPTCTGTDPCTVTIDKAKTVQAIFVGDYTLKVTSQSKKEDQELVLKHTYQGSIPQQEAKKDVQPYTPMLNKWSYPLLLIPALPSLGGHLLSSARGLVCVLCQWIRSGV